MNQAPSPLKNTVRGGQAVAHRVKAVTQLLKRILCIFLFSFFVYFCVWLKLNYSSEVYPFKLFKTIVSANYQLLLQHPDNPIEFTLPNNVTYLTTPQNILTNSLVNQQIEHFKQYLKNVLIYDALFSFVVCLIMVGLLKYMGYRSTKDNVVRGSQLSSTKLLINLLRKTNQTSDITLANVPIVKNPECSHFLITGTPGSGKSVCISELLDQVRAKNQRAIIYDKVGDFVAHYYRPDKDIILNPFDERCSPWHLWAECSDAADYDTLAASLMPLPLGGSSDPFWIYAARTIFSAAARRMQDNPKRSIHELLRYLLTAELDTLADLLKGTEAETLVSDKIAKTALSVKSVLSAHLKSLIYLKHEENAFSIRDWVKDDNQTGWLFVTSRSDKHESLKPLISTWINIAVNSLMSLTPDRNRRIWMSFDELPSLHRLPYLAATLAESRKFGGCLIASIQSIAQLREIYGDNGAEAISGLCNTRIFFRTPEMKTAEWVSQSLGQCEWDESHENVSYAINSARDGVSINRHRVLRPIVMASEIANLPNLEAYLRLAGDYPITKLQFNYQNREQRQPAFISRDVTIHSFEGIEHLLEQQTEQSLTNESTLETNHCKPPIDLDVLQQQYEDL